MATRDANEGEAGCRPEEHHGRLLGFDSISRCASLATPERSEASTTISQMSLDPTIQARLQRPRPDEGAKVRALMEGHGLGQSGIAPADIEQEVRIRLWKALERDRSAAFHTSYIQRVVLSTVIDAIRAANARPVEPLPDAGEAGDPGFIEPGAGPERIASGIEEFDRIV